MADNLTFQTGALATVPDTTVVATDDASGVHYQKVKLVDGADGSTALIGGDATNGLDVDVTRLPSLPAGTNAIGKLASNTGVTIGAVELAASQTLATVTTVSTVTAIGTSVTPGTSAAHLGKAEDAAHASGDTGVLMLAVRRDTATSDVSAAGDYAAPQVNQNGALYVTPVPNVGSGVTTYHAVAGASTNAANIKSSAGSLYGWNITNSGAAWAYVKFHNTASTPTAGSGVVWSVGVPPGGGTNESIPEGIPFGTGISVTCVTGIADNNASAVNASEININVRFK